MSSHIEYFFTCPSPFAYLGHDQLIQIAEKHNKTINFRPFNIMGVWSESGAVPPGQRPKVRQRYRDIELKRVALYREKIIQPEPKYFPTDPTLPDQTVCALVLAGENPADFTQAVGQAIWEREMQIADAEVLSELLSKYGYDADAIMALAQSEDAAKMREENTRLAIKLDAVGAPAYVYDGEVFWGQDRLDYLDQMIASGRPPISTSI